jgi:OmpA-OmpF porin, OOP family
MRDIARLNRCPFAIGVALLLSAGAAGAAGEAPVQKVTVRSVAYFGFDQASLRPADQAAMLAEVAKLKDVTWQSVTATGHTDSVGPAGYNEKLSDRRAESVKSYLVGKGLDPQMIQTASRAATVPAAPNENPAGRAKNRRAEIEFQGVRAARE